MELELIYFDGCPSWHQALDNLRQALKPLGLTMDLSLVRVSRESTMQYPSDFRVLPPSG